MPPKNRVYQRAGSVLEPPKIVWDVSIKDSAGKPSPLTEKQTLFYRENQFHRYNLIIGGLGSAKTQVLLYIAGDTIQRLFQGEYDTDRMDILFFHDTKDHCEEALIKRFYKVCPNVLYDGKGDEIYDFTKYDTSLGKGIITYTAPPPSKKSCQITFMGLRSDTGQIASLLTRGTNFDLILGTQLDMIDSEDAWYAIKGRLGRRDIKGFNCRFIGDKNPDKSWSWRLWVKGEIGKGEKESDYWFMRVGMKDNPHLSQEYKDSFSGAPEGWRKRYVDGEDDSGGGTVYEQFKQEIHCFKDEELPYRPSWKILRAMDYGTTTDPTAVVWYCLDHDGNIFFTDELETYRQTAKGCVTEIQDTDEELSVRIGRNRDFEKDLVMGGIGQLFGPTDMKKTESNQKSIGWQFLYDINDPAWRGLNVNIVGIRGIGKMGKEDSVMSMVMELLKVDPNHRNPFTGELGAPRFYVSNRCRRIIKQLEEAEFDQTNGKRLKTRIKNTYSLDPSARHHWDILDAVELAVQQFRNPQEDTTTQETSLTKYWREGSNYAKRNRHSRRRARIW